MKNDAINIAVCLDKGFVLPTGVMVYSACINNPEIDIDFHIVIDESVTEKDKRNISNTIERFQGKQVFFYHVNSQISNKFPLINNTGLTLATYYRLFFTEILPTSIDKVLYIDGDCIIRHSLLPLWEIDLSEYAIAAAYDVSEGEIEYYQRLRYSSDKGYFNAGVLLINLSYWRSHRILNDFINYLNKYSDRLLLEDQDVLNVILQDRKLFLPVKYNFQINFLKKNPKWNRIKHEQELAEAQSNPTIVHFSGGFKPWDRYVPHPHPYFTTFYRYQEQTIWKGIKQERRKLKKIIRNSLADVLRNICLLSPIESDYIEIQPID